MIKEEIQNLIEKIIIKIYPLFQSFEKEGIEILVEVPKDKNHGDYSTNVALVLSKKLNKRPLDTAKEIISKIGSNKLFEKVEVAGPGFINFYLSKDFFIGNLKKIGKNFGKNNNLKSKKIIIEYTDPNILKDFHIGHLMSNCIGESIARVIEFNGAITKKICYQGDVGLHVAKAIFGRLKNKNASWQECYVLGSKLYEEDPDAKREIENLNKKIYDKSDRIINKIYQQGRKESLESFEKIYKLLGTKFDYSFFESEMADSGKKIVESGAQNGIFKEGERGAIIFRGEKYGLHTRVFINFQGLPTYEAKDLALTKEKYGKFKYDNSVVITANEQNEYFKVVLLAMSEIFPELAKKTKHIGHGMLRLPEGKMSSRTGNIVTAESLIDIVKKNIKEKIGDREITDKEIEKISVGAIKYPILKQSIGSDIIFDFNKSISFEGDSGPYLQYSLVRANSVLEKAKKSKVKPSFKSIPDRISDLEKLIHRFPEIVEKAGKEFEPHFITNYLTELAREFNNYYAKNKIVDKSDKSSPYRIALTQAFSIIIKNGLWLLGIPTPEKM